MPAIYVSSKNKKRKKKTSENCHFGHTLLLIVYSALKGTHFYILFVVTAAGVVLCGSPKKQPRTSPIVHLYFSFGPLRSAETF